MNAPKNSPIDGASEDDAAQTRIRSAEREFGETKAERLLDYATPVKGLSGTAILLRTSLGLLALGIGLVGLAATVLGTVGLWELIIVERTSSHKDIGDVLAVTVCGITLALVSFFWLKYVFRRERGGTREN